MDDLIILSKIVIDERLNFNLYLTQNKDTETFSILWGSIENIKTNIYLGPYQKKDQAEHAFTITYEYFKVLKEVGQN